MRPVGAELGLVCDSDDVLAAGHFLRTPTGRAYVITDAREAGEPRAPYRLRWRLRAVVVRRADVPDDAVVHEFRWWRRGRR
jgi:hypothetical protein